MPWCPTCRYEYRAGFTICADCGAQLVEELPPKDSQWKTREEAPLDNPQMVFFANDETQLGILQGLLDNQNISFAVKDCYSAGSYLRTMLGKSIYGWALFVSEEYVAVARELIDTYLQENPEENYGLFPENIEPVFDELLETGTPEELAEPCAFPAAPAPDLQEQEEFNEESPVSESYDGRRRVMRVLLVALMLPTIIGLLLLPLRACMVFLPNFY